MAVNDTFKDNAVMVSFRTAVYITIKSSSSEIVSSIIAVFSLNGIVYKVRVIESVNDIVFSIFSACKIIAVIVSIDIVIIFIVSNDESV